MPATLWRYMIHHIWRRATQSMLLVVGVMIGVAMIVAIDIANNSATAAFELSSNTLTGKTTHEVIAGASGVDEQLYTEIRAGIGWQDAAPVVQEYVIAQDFDQQPILLFGIDPFAEGPFRDYLISAENVELDTGTATNIEALGRFLIQPNTVLLGRELADRYSIQPNDTIRLQYGVVSHNVTVVGLIESDDELTNRALLGMVIADISTAQEILDKPGKLTRIDLIFDDSEASQEAQEKIRAILPSSATLQSSSARAGTLARLSETFRLNLTAMSLLALVVGMFLVYNTVMFSVIQRRPILGILRSVGVTRRQIFTLVLSEAFLLSLVGAILGLGLGILLGQLTVNLVTQTMNDAIFTVTVRTIKITQFTLAKGMVMGIGAALFAALLPAYEATSTPPANSARRSEIEERTRHTIPYITGIGLAMAIIGGVLLIPNNIVINFTGIFAIIIGLAFLTALFTVVGMRLIRPITGQLGGMVGRMAPLNISRNLSRTSVAIAALMVAVSVIIGVTVMVGSLRITVRDWLFNTLRADVFISPPNQTVGQLGTPISPDIIPKLEAIEGVKLVIYERSIYVQTPDDPTPFRLTAVAFDITEGHHKFTASIDATPAEITRRVLEGEGLVMTENFANNRGIEWRDGLTITIMTDKGPHEFTVLGIYEDFSTVQGMVVIGLDNYRSLWNDPNVSNLALYVEEGENVDVVVQRIQKELAGYELVVQSNRKLRDTALDVFDRTFAITTALNLLATIVAFIGILSALMALQLERKREIGILRSNGLTRGQLFRLTLWETGIMGTMAGALAMPVGVILAFILIYVINLRSFGWTMEIALNWQFFAQAFGVAVGAALLAGLYPAWRIGRIPPAEALRSE